MYPWKRYSNDMSYFLSVFGLVLIIEGMPYFAFPEKMKELLSKLPLLPSGGLRVFGATAVLAQTKPPGSLNARSVQSHGGLRYVCD